MLLEREGASLLPSPLLPRPRPDERSSSSRIRKRHRLAMGTWRSANKLLASLNSLDRGRCGTTTELRSGSWSTLPDDQVSPAQLRARRLALLESARIERWRGDSDRTGAHATATLLNISVVELYGLRGKAKHIQVPMIAKSIDEPVRQEVVDMLEALPREEAEYFRRAQRT